LLIPFAVIEYKYSSFSNLFANKKTGSTSTGISKYDQSLKTEAERTTKDTYQLNQTKENAAVANEVNTPAASEQKPDNPDRLAVTAVDDPAKTVSAVATNKHTIDPNVTDPVREHSNIVDDLVNNNLPIANKRITHKKKQQVHITGSKIENEVDENINKAIPKRTYASKQKFKVSIKNVAATTDEDDNKIASIEKPTVTVETIDQKILLEDSNAIAKKEDTLAKRVMTDTLKAVEKVDGVKKVAKEEKKNKPTQKHFYAGLVLGPDFSTVKLQSVKRTGLSFGLIAGYSLNKKFSIETGFLYDKKMYSSKGKYFSTKNITVYPNSSLGYVTGQCSMYEIPLNLRYSFREKQSASWFIVGGISSYLMNKEKYEYDIIYMGTSYPYSHDYKSHENQFAAVINLSVGYTRKIGRLGDLRIEPYLKFPVSKVGTGELPIQSGGIMIGFTRKLF
ncbi:MAG: porin family protein, partial [Ferruginibacter sp.]